MTDNLRKVIFFSCIVFCLLPFASPPIGLFMGLLLALTLGNPYQKDNNKVTGILLRASVIALGFGMNLFEAAKAGQEGFLFTFFTICLTLIAGIFFGKLFGIEKRVGYLISVGTAICGGSAIAAVSPIIEAKKEEMSVSLGTVFILNSVGLVLFPVIGTYFGLSQAQFGLWSAVAIHDTSSVVGAAHKYGEEALQIATTIKLERALWIIPVSFVTAIAFKHKASKIKIPYFIFFFIGAMALNTFLPQISSVGQIAVMLGKKGLTVTLFLIGSGLSLETIRKVGLRPLLLGIILWLLISSGSLFVISKAWQ